MTDVEQKFLDHLWADRVSAGRRELMRRAEWYAATDKHQLSRLPDLLQEEIDKHRATKKETT